MHETAIVVFAGRTIHLGWETSDFSVYKQPFLKKYGAYMGEDSIIYISNKASREYQISACLFECLSPNNAPGLVIRGAESCDKLEKKIITEFVLSKKRNVYARRRLGFFKALLVEEPENKSYADVVDMLEKLIPTLHK